MRVPATYLLPFLAAIACSAGLAHEGHGSGQPAAQQQPKKKPVELGSSAAFDTAGQLWFVAVEDGRIVLRSSGDVGVTWSAPIVVTDGREPVSADGENRPKLVFGPHGQFYVTWTMPTSPRYTADIRFSRSLNGGRTWSAPATVHENREIITHRFDSIIVARDGRIFVVWIDKRDLERHTREGRSYRGAAIYYAVSEDEGASWRGDFKLADHACECCRIAVALDVDGVPLAMWRHVFPGSERDHALARLDPAVAEPVVERVTFDRWKVEACPHHGPSIVLDDKGVRHAVWFNHSDGKPGAFYGRLGRGRVEGMRHLGADAEHADLAVTAATVRVVWKRFDGTRTTIEGQVSRDGGRTWTANTVASTSGKSDQPRLVTRGDKTWLVWRTEEKGIVVRELP